VLLAGLGEALLALVENFGGHVGELGAQRVTGLLQVFQTLLVAFLLLTQFGLKAGGLRFQPAQFGFTVGTFKVPGVSCVTGVVAVLTVFASLRSLTSSRLASNCACKPA